MFPTQQECSNIKYMTWPWLHQFSRITCIASHEVLGVGVHYVIENPHEWPCEF